MSTTIESAYAGALRAPVRQMADECQRLLGQRLVAYVTGHKSPKIVGRWALGQNEPHDDARERLRALYRVVLILRETEQPDTIRAWLVGANPQLDDKAPVELLRNDEFVPAYKAAENFVDA